MVYDVFMKKVIALPNTRAIPKSGLANLKRLYEEAKSGDIVSYAVIGVRKNGAYVRAWNHERGLALIGAVEAMKAEIVNDFLKG